MAQTGKVLMVVTGTRRIPGTDIDSGFFLRELTHPYFAVTEAGYEVDVATIQGGAAPIDPHSDPRNPNSEIKDDIISMGMVHSPQHAAKIAATLPLAQADPDAYDAVFFAGGAGAIFDLPFDASAQNVARRLWETGRIVGAVCHGVAALLDVTLPGGDLLVCGREVTGYTTEEDNLLTEKFPAFHPPLFIDREMQKRGALYSRARANEGYAVTSADGRLVTGQNNRSGTIVGRHLVAALQGEPRRRDTVTRA